MLKIEKTVLPSPEQWEIVIEGMRNPKNSWDRIDSYTTYIEDPQTLERASYEHFVGGNDMKLMKQLAKGGSVHAKYRRMLPVVVTFVSPLYFLKEFDTYKFAVSNSCSTMHKIHSKPFNLDDFSHEHMTKHSLAVLDKTIDLLNHYRKKFLVSKEKNDWWQLIQLLPSSYNQKRTVMLNYEVLCNIYHSRKDHKLDEWHVFCDWIKTLPYAAELITGEQQP